MSSGNFLTMGSVFYSILLLIVFFSKKTFKSLENKIYSYLIVCNFIGLILAVLCYYTVLNSNVVPVLNFVVSRLYLIYLVSYIYIFFTYLLAIIYCKDNIIPKVIKRVINILIISFVFIVALVYMLPLYYHNENMIVYSYGPSANVIYVLATVCMSIWTILLIANYKKITNKKFLPIIFFIIGSLIVTIIQKKNPGLLLMTSLETYITIIMYFTIENPDMKILEEVHNAKVISDNANEEKTMFLYNMTSSLREITKDINYEADYIIDESSTKKPDLITINDSAREIKVSTGKFTTMTNEMLDVSHLDAASIKVYNDKYNIKLILKEIITIYKDKIKNKNLDFRTNIQSDLPEYLYGDALNLKNVLTSLLDNSLKYTNKGYIELSVNYIKKNDIARLIISIEDSGIGIKSTELEKIFNKNKEELNKYNLKNNLYTARKLVTLMGGTIIASSTFGVGTIMKVVLDQKIDADTNNNYDKVLDKKKILLVEDSSVTTKLITKYLKDSNVIIDTVELGSDALDKIRNHEKYDLILLEEDLKPLDAYTIIKKLNQIKNFNIKVVLLTKNTSLEYNETYKDQGFTNVLIKPIDKEKLINVINGKDEQNGKNI